MDMILFILGTFLVICIPYVMVELFIITPIEEKSKKKRDSQKIIRKKGVEHV